MGKLHRLTATAVTKASVPGYYADGGNLVLQVSSTGSKSWVFRYVLAGRRREMGMGPLHTVSLADARQAAAKHRRTLLAGDDPIELRNATRRTKLADAARAVTFQHCAERCIKDRRAEWSNPKHAAQWAATLATYAYPHIGELDVRSIDTALVRKCLDPIWTTKTETASRVRQRIEAVLDWAAVHGHREGNNPARWRGHLEAVLARPTKIAKAEHHAAIAYADIPAVMHGLHHRDNVSARALRFTILTAARTGETIGATWAEIDMGAKLWTIPAERMKARVQHQVPLSDAALAILMHESKLQGSARPAAPVFPGARKGQPLSNMAMLELVRGMALKDATGETATVHGMRSAFRDWAAEATTHPRDVAEHALAHKLPDKTEAAYQRGTLLAKRRALMNDWAKWCSGTRR
jgi:integrase